MRLASPNPFASQSGSTARIIKWLAAVTTLVTIIAAGLVYFVQSSPPPTNEIVDYTAPDVSIRTDARKRIAIIFIHGLTGNSRDTWTSGGGAFWPELVKDDAAFVGTTIFSYGYFTKFNWASLAPKDLIPHIYRELEAEGLLAHDKIVFVAHSMGGLVVQKLLLDYPSLMDKVGFIYFLGVPSTGSTMAALAEYLFANREQYRALLPRNAEEQTEDFNVQWSQAGGKDKFGVLCGYELNPVAARWIIATKASAQRLCGADILQFTSDHINIVKPDHTGADVHKRFRERYLRFKVEQAQKLRHLAWNKYGEATEENSCSKAGKFYEEAVRLITAASEYLSGTSDAQDAEGLKQAPNVDLDRGTFMVNWAVNCGGLNEEHTVRLAREARDLLQRIADGLETDRDRGLAAYYQGRVMRFLAFRDPALNTRVALELAAELFRRSLNFAAEGSDDMGSSLASLGQTQYDLSRYEEGAKVEEFLRSAVESLEKAGAILKGATWERQASLFHHGKSLFGIITSNSPIDREMLHRACLKLGEAFMAGSALDAEDYDTQVARLTFGNCVVEAALLEATDSARTYLETALFFYKYQGRNFPDEMEEKGRAVFYFAKAEYELAQLNHNLPRMTMAVQRMEDAQKVLVEDRDSAYTKRAESELVIMRREVATLREMPGVTGGVGNYPPPGRPPVVAKQRKKQQ